MKLRIIFSVFVLFVAAITANAQDSKRDKERERQLADFEQPERVSTNTIHKSDAHKLEKSEGRRYSRKEPRVIHGVKLSKKDWRKRVKEQSFETKPVKKLPKESAKNKKDSKSSQSKGSK